MQTTPPIEREAEKRLLKLQRFGIKLGLEQTRELFSRLGAPQNNLKFAHIAGTNGKGSVCAMLSAGLTSAGFTTGFYSSPHLVAARERFRINGRAISAEQFADQVDKLMPVVKSMADQGKHVTYFEATTAIAAMAFKDADAKFAVWETGLGGRFDATNIVEPEVCVITSVALEHTKHLGSTIAEIAFEKAGIIKPGVPVFCGNIQDAAKELIEKRAKELDAPCFFIPTSSPSPFGTTVDMTAGMPTYGLTDSSSFALRDSGGHADSPTHRLTDSPHHPPTSNEDELFRDFREENATLAKITLRHLSAKFAFPLNTALDATRDVKWPARYHKVGNKTIVDGAHNPDAIDALASILEIEYPGRRWTIIFAALDDKEIKPIFKKLSAIADNFVFPTLTSTDRATPPAKIAKILHSISQISAEIAPDVATALRMTEKSSSRLIVGSLYLAGEALAELLPIEQITDIHRQ